MSGKRSIFEEVGEAEAKREAPKGGMIDAGRCADAAWRLAADGPLERARQLTALEAGRGAHYPTAR